MKRREFLKKSLGFVGALTFASLTKTPHLFSEPSTSLIQTRPFGKTGIKTTLFSLGGEGVLRTYGRAKEAVPMIERAIEIGVNYCDTAPAYSESQDYYGRVFQDSGKRDKVFLASKTHARDYGGSMRLLEDSLRRLRTDHLDLWQLHNLMTPADLDEIFSKNGAIHAVEEARKKGSIRFVGVTGHYDPEILKQAIERYDFDTVLVALNAADRHFNSFIEEFLPVAQGKGMGIIGMKVFSRGALLAPSLLSPREAMSYVLSLPVTHVILGCSTPEEVEENFSLANQFKALSPEEMQALEARTAPWAHALCGYKNGA
jgi:predicted aldo/keto reductase-like oxidoreductase